MPSAYNQEKKEHGREDINGLMADLASRPQVNKGRRKLKGPERAAVLMLSLGERYGGKIFSMLDDDELREISTAVSSLGTIDAASVEELLLEFVSLMSGSGGLLGSYDVAERLLQQYLPKERVGGIMDDIRGPAGRNMWEKLAHVHEEVLANYLKNEYPQTVAVVMSKLRAGTRRARAGDPARRTSPLDVVNRMLKMEAVQKEVIDRVEETLRTEFMSNLSQTRRRDAHEVMAEIFNNFDRQTETRFLTALEEENPDAAERIKALMFTFDDLIKLDSRLGADADAQIREGQAGDRAQGRLRRRCASSSSATCPRAAPRCWWTRCSRWVRCACATSTRRRRCWSISPRIWRPRAKS